MKIAIGKTAFIETILNGVSQIMLQENKWTGLLFITGLFVGNWLYGVAAIIATISGTLTSILLKNKASEIKAGLYGFSPALVGVALIALFKDTMLVWFCVVAGSALAAILQHFFIVRKIPVYTLPFILVSWFMVFTIREFFSIPASEIGQGNIVPYNFNSFYAIANGFGEVIFQGALLSGVLFLIGVFISSPIAAIYGLAASFAGAVLSWMYGQPIEQINIGLFGFNAVLTAIAFSGTKKTDGIWILIGSLITIFLHIWLVESHLLDGVGGVFTFPFVAGTWITILIQKLFRKK